MFTAYDDIYIIIKSCTMFLLTEFSRYMTMTQIFIRNMKSPRCLDMPIEGSMFLQVVNTYWGKFSVAHQCYKRRAVGYSLGI